MDGEGAVLAKIAEKPEPDRAIAARLHAVVSASAPTLSPRLWYGMPAYAKDGDVVCFLQGAQTFKTRYATFGFNDKAKLDEGAMWPTAFALESLTAAEGEGEVMRKWLRRIRGAIGMGLTWAVGWALAGMVIGSLWTLGIPMEWFVEVFDAPLPALAVPGFFSGAAFSTVLGIAGRRRRFDELSLPGFTAWGAAGGLLLSLFPVAAMGAGAPIAAIAVVVGTLTLLSAASAAGTLVLARRAEDRDLLEAGAEVAEVGLTRGEAKELLGGRG